MLATVTVDVAGGQIGGAARFRAELSSYLSRTKRADVHVIGTGRQVDPVWLVRRELASSARGRRVAVNNVSFVAPGSQRWTLLRNPLDFMTDQELSTVARSARLSNALRASVVHCAARRADTLVVPSTAMAERVTRVLPQVAERIVVRPHPVSADAIPRMSRRPVILCPVLFSPFKGMTERLTDLVGALDEVVDSSVRLLVTANISEVPAALTSHPRIDLVGRLDHRDLRQLWASSQAIYFPTELESFGYPLAEARVSGHPVIALDTTLSREIAGPALCGFRHGDAASLRQAVQYALTRDVIPDPAAFDPDRYFDWLLGVAR